ncbi:hypothetical protein DFQ28_008703 [Apophysomyces sp. BC1034]|nr:putative PKS/NRPS-like protein biosynthetic cluster [Apophysomyces sp. BC1015]KAG0192581.1 hypothetical protein DFQ28_008703 [Apophysomyces sp. BC1034]
MSVYMFPGQGSQSKGMGDKLFALFPELTTTASEILGYSIQDLCIKDPYRQLNDTRYTQPALYVVNALSYRQRHRETSTRANYLIGHSLGEFNALQASGAMSFEDGLKLVKKRGELMSMAPEGAMAAVIGLTETAVREMLKTHSLTDIDIANLNSPTQIILSGSKESIIRAATFFETRNIRYVPLNTSGAFHSRYMEAAKREFESFLKNFAFSAPSIPVISNVDARSYQANCISANLAVQITHPVQWKKSIQYLLAQGEDNFEELGVGQVLTRLLAEIKKHPLSPILSADSVPIASIPIPVIQQPVALSHDRSQALAVLRQQINAWNRNYPVGTQVKTASLEGPVATKTQAMMLFGHRAAIYLEGYDGYFELSSIQPVKAN